MVPRGAVALALFLLVGSLAAGCVGPGEPELDGNDAEVLSFASDWYARALPNGDGHDHTDRDHHRGLSTPNFQVLGWDPLATDHYGESAGGTFCGDLAEGERTLAVTHSFTSDIAFILFDVTDPTAPFAVGELLMPSTHVWDVAMTPDQRHVLLATSPLGHADGEDLPLAIPDTKIAFRSACTGLETPLAGPEAMLPYHSGVVLVDIADPSAPVVRDFRPLPVLGGHSIVAKEIGGETRVLVTVTNAGPTNYHVFLGLMDTPAGAVLDLHSVYQTQSSPVENPGVLLFSNHDGTLQEHPKTGEALAYLAEGHWGVTILNIDDPRAPVVVARWDEARAIANDQAHFAHSVLPIEGTWDGRHYTFFGEECGGRPEDTPSCLIYALDTTDPADPRLAGAWTLPHDMGPWSYPEFSVHYMALIERTLFVASWHAGLWAIDVSTPEALATMPAIGVFLPDEDPPFYNDGYYGADYNLPPVVADVLVADGNLVVLDGTSGAYVVAFDATRPAPSPPPWPLNVE